MKKQIIFLIGTVIFFLALSYAFVPQVLSGKIVNQSDISGWQGMSKEMMDWNRTHPDDQTAWTESMFGGMPTTTIHASTKGDWTQAIYDFLLTGKRPATYLFISLLGAFLMLLALGISPLVAAGGAIAVTFCSYNIQIIQVGHNTKMQALSFLPWVMAGLIMTYRKALERGSKLMSWLPGTALGAALFALALSFQVKANHPQITYYLALMIFIYALVVLVSLLCKAENRKKLGRFFAASALLLILGVCGLGTNAIKLLPTWEYTPYSMRGGSTAKEDGSKASKGLDLDYATAWSYGWEELPNLAIPNYNGGSSAGAVNPRHSETYDLLKSAGVSHLKETCSNLPLYWGPQPFTAGPMYMGAVTIFLFIFGLMYWKGKEKWWVVAASLLAVLLALGSHFLWFTRLFYEYAPLYNKFRTVSMALVVLQFTLPVLGFLMLDSIVKSSSDNKTLTKQIITAGSVSAGLCLVLALVQSLTGSFSGAVDAGQQDILVDALIADRHHLLWVDTWRSVILILAASAILIWGVTASRKVLAAVLVSALVLLDLFIVDKRYLNADDFTTPKAFSSQFAKRPVDELILEDTDLSYRVLDLSVDVFNDSHPSYWHKNIGGYSPAKLQRYQEYIDSHLRSEIKTLCKSLQSAKTIQEAEEAMPYLEGLANLNCRYVIIDGSAPPLYYGYARGNAWFEDVEGSAEMTSYAPNELHYSCESAEGGKLVFSEVYYPVGWTLVMDGTTELPIELYGEVLRSASIPAGSHSLVMRFDPPSYSRGEAVSRACSIVLIIIVLASVAGAVLFKKKEENL